MYVLAASEVHSRTALKEVTVLQPAAVLRAAADVTHISAGPATG
jgi:hypothetical protein